MPLFGSGFFYGVYMWPRGPTKWIEGRLLRVSIPFTWNLPQVREYLFQRSFLWDIAEVGGPAVELIPNFFSGMDWVTEGHECQEALKRINPDATRTTEGCPFNCGYCAIGTGRIEPEYKELSTWQNGHVYCDNNILAASDRHLEKVFGECINRGTADFNQGIDARLLTSDHAEYLAAIDDVKVRLALDGRGERDKWTAAVETLVEAGVSRKNISSYCLVGFNSDPAEAWERCEWAEKFGVMAMPMWFHELDSLEWNKVTDKQTDLGWSDKERLDIMGYYWQHRGAVKYV